MAFTISNVVTVPGTGAKAHVFGTYTNDGGSTGGDVVTGLNVVEAFLLQPKGAAVSANQPVVNETFPLTNTGGAVTIVTSANEVGQFLAIGY